MITRESVEVHARPRLAIASIAAPDLVTGTDPTRIPIAALIAPIVGKIVTRSLALNATARREPR